MQLITEEQVRAHLALPDAVQALRDAFLQHGRGHGAMLARNRAAVQHEGQALMVSAMGAVLAGAGVMGTKVYSSINGQFQFVITLFCAKTGKPLATLEANELTRLRTSAATAVAAEALAPLDAKVLSIFGAGTQAKAHVQALLPLRGFERVLISARSGAAEFAAELGAAHGIKAEATDAATAARESDVIATCTRATDPLFDGALVKPGAFVAAVGSSKPVARELDDALLARAALIAVEWLPAAEQEAGEFKRAAPGVIDSAKVAELGSLLVAPRLVGKDDIVVYKSVGIGLEDVALAQLVLQRVQAMAA